MQTITISKIKLIIGAALVVAVLIGGVIGLAMGEHGGRDGRDFKHEGRYGNHYEMNDEQDQVGIVATTTVNITATGTVPQAQ